MRRIRRIEKGITLVALVITIVVIIILAMITINFLFGEGGIVTKAQEAAKMSNIESTREKLEIATGTAIIEGKGETSIDAYWDIIAREEIIGDKNSDTSDNRDGTYDVITNDGFIFQVMPIPDKDNANDILIDYVGDIAGPRITRITGTTTTNSASIQVETTNAENATYKYEYKKNGETEWKVIEGVKGSSCTIEGLEDETIYNIRVTVETNKGTSTRRTSVKTGKVEGKITFETPVWQGDGTASIKASTSETGYTLQYQIKATDGTEPDEDAWEAVAENGIITGIEHNETVFVRLWDGNNGSSYASAEIKDENQPKDATIELSPTNSTTGTTVTATVTHNDAESGSDIEKCKYVWNTVSEKLGTDESLYADGTFSSNGQQISRTINELGIYYLHILTIDRAGNKWETVSEAVDNTNTAPSVPTVAFISKTNTALTVTALSTDEEGDNLSYTLYAGTTSGNLNKVSSAVSKSQNQTATITLSGLSSYTYYYWRVDVSDGTATTKGTEQSRVRTYCYTTRCTSGHTTANGRNCSTCSGTGKRTSTCTACNGKGSITTKCNTCGGDGKCSGSISVTEVIRDENSAHAFICSYCGMTQWDAAYRYHIRGKCSTCGKTFYEKSFCSESHARYSLNLASHACSECNQTGSISTSCSTCGGDGQTSTSCTTCGGDGKVTSYTYCSHGYSSSHYWCTHGNNMGASKHD